MITHAMLRRFAFAVAALALLGAAAIHSPAHAAVFPSLLGDGRD